MECGATMSEPTARQALLDAARQAALTAYAPYSGFHVGAAFRFDDGTIITGSNFENASYGLAICAETSAAIVANLQGRRTGLVEVAIMGGPLGEDGQLAPTAAPVTPCGRCRQVMNELAQLGGTDPIVYSGHATGSIEHRLSVLLPAAFGPANLE
ncbi:cytidine deaminase [Blastomonas sp. AAP53]|uniref:cytidine deaminase n=1 Tax=Blastomonas sp. AAP53 TaxID=1248760 RepID=UPI0031B7F87E